MSDAAFVVIGQGGVAPARLAHEAFASAAGLEARLRATVRGEVRFDAASRALYATDASHYRQVPIGVVMPRDAEDVVAAVAACREFGAPVLGRGAGTSLAGQGCNVAVVLDFSRWMDEVTVLDGDCGIAWVQPGVVLDRLRERAEQHKLTFAPDPATHSRCTLGGMIGNNSCGVHALMGGKTVDNIERMEVLLYDGTRLMVGPTTEAELAAKIAAGGREGEIYAGLKGLRDRYAELVRARFPDIPRRVSGYNLDQLLPENGFNVARALVGTEGTCVTVLEAECRLVRSPQFRRLVGLGFESGFVAADHVPEVLAFEPIGLEGFDGLLVDCMQRKNLAVDDVCLLPRGGGILLCEFGGDSDEEVNRKAEAFAQAAATFAAAPSIARYNHAEAMRVWHVRESALGATVFVPGEPSGWEGWEDSAVPPAKLGAYLRDLFAVMDRYGYRAPMYGHFGQGCVHMRISFDFTTTEGVRKYREFLEEAADCVLRYGGSFSGEHGDGQSRAALLPKMFGPELMEAFREFKALWDPANKMNPGKLVDAMRVYEPTENLRRGPEHRPARVETYFSFAEDGGSFSDATDRCVGVGACRKTDGGTMCPSYMATREERHSTRGRAHLLWEMMTGDVIRRHEGDRLREEIGVDGPAQYVEPRGELDWRNDAVKEALDLCLSCKACKTECPVNVDMASWKAEFLAHYYEGRRHPLRDYGFGFMDKWARVGSVAPWAANLGARLPGVKALLGVAAEREMPRLARQSFTKGFKASGGAGEEVLLWADTWDNYFYPQALDAAALVLGQCGKDVRVPRQHVCCGRPLYDFGFLKEAKAYLARVLTMFAREIDAGVPVVMLEPSCASVFKDELLQFFPQDERARKLAAQTKMLSEVVAAAGFVGPDLAGRDVMVQGHCHQKALMTMKDEVRLLEGTGARVNVLDSGCCGMAGPFGFEREKYAVSQAIGERVLLPAVRGAPSQTIVVGNGFSCREQIVQGTGRRAVHLSEVLAGRL